MIRALTRLRNESRINGCVVRVAVWPDKPCTRGHMTSAAVLHIESNEAISHATCNVTPVLLALRRPPFQHLLLRQPPLRFIARPRPSHSCAPTVHPRLRSPWRLAHFLASRRLSALSVRRLARCSVHRTRDQEWDTSVSRHLQ